MENLVVSCHFDTKKKKIFDGNNPEIFYTRKKTRYSNRLILFIFHIYIYICRIKDCKKQHIISFYRAKRLLIDRKFFDEKSGKYYNLT